MKTDRDKEKVVEVYSGSSWEANLVRSILEDNEIEVYLENDTISSILPLDLTQGSVGIVRVVVLEEFEEKAKEIITEIKF